MEKNYIKQNRSGFTLVELLVVVAIIAILSTIGLTLFTGAQANARDARRKSEIDAIAVALESKRAPGSIWYSVIDDTAFSSGAIPTDTTIAKYCLKVYAVDNGAKTEGNPATWAPDADCPANFKQAITGTGNGFDNTAGTGFFLDITNKSFKVCARLESSTTAVSKVYCKNSAQ